MKEVKKVPSDFSSRFWRRLKTALRSHQLDSILKHPVLSKAAEETAYNFWTSGRLLKARTDQRHDLQKVLNTGIRGADETASACRWLAKFYGVNEMNERAAQHEETAHHLRRLLANSKALPQVKRLGVGKSYAFIVMLQELVVTQMGKPLSHPTVTQIVNAGRPDGEVAISSGQMKTNTENFRTRNPPLVQAIKAAYRKHVVKP